MFDPDHENFLVTIPEYQDYKAEVIAAALIEQGYDPEKIIITREGISRRGFSKEVENIFAQVSFEDSETYIHINANKEGIYDMLPEGIFHQPLKGKRIKDREDILEEIKIHKNEELFARRFFHLFELLADKTLTDASYVGLQYDRKITNGEFSKLFTQYWSILKLLDNRQSVFFIYLIPILNKLRTDYNKVAEALSFILDATVKISEITLLNKKVDNSFAPTLGTMELAVGFVLGDCFNDGEKDIQLMVGPIDTNKYIYFIEGNKGFEILERLCDIFLPCSKFIIKNFIIDKEISDLILSDDHNSTFLGVNSFL